MYCKKCGELISDDSKFCAHCGAMQMNTQLKSDTQQVIHPLTVKKLEGLFGLNLSKKVIGVYLLWLLLHLIILLVYWDSNKYANRHFWPFSDKSDIEDYNLSEFLLYTLVPLIGIITFNLFSNSDDSLTNKNDKYDLSYENDSTATIVGFFILVVTIVFPIITRSNKDEDKIQEFRAIMSFATLIFRIVSTIWVISIAKKQNRDTTGWGLFAFFLPSLSLIFAGLNKKLKTKVTH